MDHLTLYDLNLLIKNTLSKTLEASYWVIGEIADFRVHPNGHCYLELVEKEGNQIRAKTRATIWSSSYSTISFRFAEITGQHLKSGMKILFNAAVQYHEVYGLSLIIRDIDAQYTIGERARKRQEIIDKLKTDGVYDMNRELALPLVPQRIAVISSESAAGYGDFLNQLNQNEFGYSFSVTLFPSLMQGEKAENSIINSLHRINSTIELFDVVVIIRGGGASLDLDCFDNYELGGHIAQFPIPVITGIGHERDETIADLVAHKKLKTPTAVAVFLVEALLAFENILDEHFSYLTGTLSTEINAMKSSVEQLSNRLFRKGQYILNSAELQLSRWSNTLSASAKNLVKNQHILLDKTKMTISNQPKKILESQDKMLNLLERQLRAIDPVNVLKRGFSMTTIHGKNINSVSEIPEGSLVKTISHMYEIDSTVVISKKLKH